MDLTTFESHSPDDSARIAGELAGHLGPGDIVGLIGGLGAGKTHFAGGLARALGFHGAVTSPTFSLVHEYPGKCPIYHMDLYRLESESEILGIGFEEYLSGRGICLIEWPERAARLMTHPILCVELVSTGENSRRIHVREARLPLPTKDHPA
ncbi:MAG: tRNA (adenosine(37)-N6)-threonylcarbamoyltransferase complex ATPase subunit type 1 TsaE [Verrucomicrobiae bacterium]|nr:tRNA (adenosine(37)-N6)-threonylcarbamoyltransferase complex ATPase subunit type 1 TsaE [Verrucomicrobiae bacterium]